MTLTLEDVVRYPRPGTAVPRRLEFTPDGRHVAFLYSEGGTLVQSLWTHDLDTGERRRIVGPASDGAIGALSLEEQLRRERARVRELGVSDYAFGKADGGETLLLVPYDGKLLLGRGDGPPTPLEGGDGALEARLSPDGTHVAFVRDDELYVLPLTDGVARGLTSSARDGVTNGVAEYVAQEEMDRAEGYWWSQDGTHLAFVQADSTAIPLYPIVHQGGDDLAVEEHRYPFSGARNATVRLGVVPRDGAPDDVVWMDLGPDADVYLARVAWRPDGVLTAQIESRDQRTLRVVAFDGRTGAATTLIEESGGPWLNLSNAWRSLTSGEFIFSSEKSGHRHLSLYDRDGKELRLLTSGEWMVTDIAAVDEERRIVYCHGTREGVLERHLYAVGLDDASIRRVTAAPGWHAAVVSPDCQTYIDGFSALDAAPSFVVKTVPENVVVAVLHEGAATTPASLGLLVPELATLQTRDGATLHAAIYASDETRASTRPHPLVVSVYGGPQAQRVAAQWDLTVDMRAQYLAQQGFVVLKVDNRGSANRGLAFEAPLALHMGGVEVDDQVDGVRWLTARPYVDGARVGIYGWSYGGYMTCMMLMRAPDVFSTGVAGAPVTFWEGYDTHYTERYMATPASNPEGYRESSVLRHVASLQGDLLLIHGLVDENVHVRHTMRLVTALIAADKPYDLALFPAERHMPRDAAGLLYLEQRLTAHLTRTLQG